VSSARAIIRSVPGATAAYLFADRQRRRLAARASLKDLRTRDQEIWLDLGGGDRHGEGGWTTVDLVTGCDLYWDLRRGLPFANNTVSRIYSSHLFEHLTFADGQRLMVESLRALRPQGSFSICVPNAALYISSYVERSTLPGDYFGWGPAFNSTTPIDAVNYIAYMDGHHKYMFDEDNLVRRLELAGYADVRSREFDPSIDMAERDYESIYAVGFKPAR
jgi:predicted SAM-dependent methyltransferase